MTKEITPERLARMKFRDVCGRWRQQGIEIEITYDEWFNWWLNHGIDKRQRQPKANKKTLVMCRLDRTKPVRLDNVVLGTYGANDLGLPSSHKDVPKYAVRKNKDEWYHIRYQPYLRARAQWNFRGEKNDLTFDEWCELWTDELWPLRGRKTLNSDGEDSYTLTRIDPEGAWTRTNVEVVTRTEQIRRAREYTKLRKL